MGMIGLLALSGRRRLTNQCIPFFRPAQCFQRGYALSRFPERRTGFGRNSGRKTTQGASAGDAGQQTSESPFTYEEQPSAYDSQLWGSGQRVPSSNPEEGL